VLRRAGERGRMLASADSPVLDAQLAASLAERQALTQHVAELEGLLTDARARNERLEDALAHSHSSLQEELRRLATPQVRRAGAKGQNERLGKFM
jgi:chorismate mutase